MKNLKLALCFLDEEDNIVVKKDFTVTWKHEVEEDARKFLNIKIMDEVATIISYEIQSDIPSVIRELLDEMGRIKE